MITLRTGQRVRRVGDRLHPEMMDEDDGFNTGMIIEVGQDEHLPSQMWVRVSFDNGETCVRSPGSLENVEDES